MLNLDPAPLSLYTPDNVTLLTTKTVLRTPRWHRVAVVGQGRVCTGCGRLYDERQYPTHKRTASALRPCCPICKRVPLLCTPGTTTQKYVWCPSGPLQGMMVLILPPLIRQHRRKILRNALPSAESQNKVNHCSFRIRCCVICRVICASMRSLLKHRKMGAGGLLRWELDPQGAHEMLRYS